MEQSSKDSRYRTACRCLDTMTIPDTENGNSVLNSYKANGFVFRKLKSIAPLQINVPSMLVVLIKEDVHCTLMMYMKIFRVISLLFS
jgi:hypothetical protein